MKLLKLASYAALGLALSMPISAFALVGGAGIDPNTPSSPWSGVGSLDVGGNWFTATMIAPGYVLTAAHVVNGAAAANVSFQVNAGTSYTIGASDIFINPAYTGSIAGNAAGDPTTHDDLAIIKLTGTAGTNIPFYDLYSGDLQSADLNFVSYGSSSTAKKTGENIADVLFTNAAGTNQTFMFDFDGPTGATNVFGGGTLGANREASFISGDSGSAAFVNVNGQWLLAGINTFEATFNGGPTTQGAFGTGGGGVVLNGYVNWINSVIATPVPEPEDYLMLIAGLGLVFTAVNRRAVKKA